MPMLCWEIEFLCRFNRKKHNQAEKSVLYEVVVQNMIRKKRRSEEGLVWKSWALSTMAYLRWQVQPVKR
jgi:hypothetical protein